MVAPTPLPEAALGHVPRPRSLLTGTGALHTPLTEGAPGLYSERCTPSRIPLLWGGWRHSGWPTAGSPVHSLGTLRTP